MANLLTPEEKVPVTIEDEVRRSYLDYAMSVIIGRALPDVRDGLKPVHRRCLYGMWEQGNLHNKPYRKSARIVGDVLGKYHPHGESAVYDSVVRMAQEFSLRYPLVDGQGNFGSIDGDNAAAMRYTEVRLTRLSAELLGEDIDKETVDWTPNYDGSLVEPMVLPAKFPNLLVNGSTGIAVGMATNIPPHNLSEVIDATVELIKHPEATLAQLMKRLPGPDFPTGAFIHGAEGIRDAYKTGRGIGPGAGPGDDREGGARRQGIDRRHRDSLSGQQGQADRAHRRARQRQEDRRGLGPARRVQPRRHAHRRRVEARRERPGRSQQALRPDADAELLRHHLPRDRGQPAPRAASPRAAPPLHRPPQDRRHPAHAVRPEEGRGTGSPVAGPGPGAGEPRPRDQDHPGLQGLRGGEGAAVVRGFDDAGGAREVHRLFARRRRRQGLAGASPRRDPGAGDPRHAAAPPDGPRARKDRRRVQGGPRPDREAAGDPGFRDPRARDHRRRAPADQETVRRRAADGDRGRGLGHRHRGSDRRGGHGHHRVPRRLHQALSPLALPRAAARRQGPDRSDHEGRGPRRAPVRGVDARVRARLHVDGPHALDQGLRPSPARARHSWQGDRQPAVARPQRADGGDGRDERLPGKSLS